VLEGWAFDLEQQANRTRRRYLAHVGPGIRARAAAVTPPDQAATQTELAQLHTLESERNTRGLDLVSYWDAGAPAYRWNEIAIRRLESIGRPEVVADSG
jgi:hypothetical protein